jgi:hypothetical protein
MDRKAGYKECPRCGLRNKPSALQCDFCGLRFIAGEDWDDNIQALEKMGGNEEKVLVDEDISKRIEATIVKRDKIDAQPKAKEPGKDDFDYFKKEPEPVRSAPAPAAGPSIAMARGTVIETVPEQRQITLAPEPVQAPAPTPIQAPVQATPPPIEPVPAPVPEPAEKILIPEQPPVVAAPPPEPVREKKVVRRVIRPTKHVFVPAKTSMRRTVFIAVLLLGLVWYLVSLLFGVSTLGRAGGWVLVTISTMMVVGGAAELFIPKGEAKMSFTEGLVPATEAPVQTHKEVLICPKCHELVSANDKACPDCGAEFRSE